MRGTKCLPFALFRIKAIRRCKISLICNIPFCHHFVVVFLVACAFSFIHDFVLIQTPLSTLLLATSLGRNEKCASENAMFFFIFSILIIILKQTSLGLEKYKHKSPHFQRQEVMRLYFIFAI